MSRSVRKIFLVVTLVVLSCGVSAYGATYPNKPVRFIVTFSPGGGTDIMARVVAQRLTEKWGEVVLVDNRAGGNGNMGTDMVAKAVADGYTIVVTTNATIVINPHLMKLPYDPVKDFAPVTQWASLPFAFLVHPSVPANNVAELISLAKTKPGHLTFASSGSGGGAHLSGELLKTMTGIDMTHVPYKGGGPALLAVAAGQVHMMFLSIMTSTPMIEQKKVRVIAVTGATRSSALPNVPAVAETPGLAGFETDLWYGMLAPAKTEARVVDKIYQDTKTVLLSAELRNRFEPTGVTMIASTPGEFAKTIKSDLAKWAPVIKASGATMD
jgi:tripartite-type tricarboxylate transporter receptor subunit TctC